jgi:hypothetical protein
MRKDVILRSVAPLKDDIFGGVVLTCYQCTAPLGLYIAVRRYDSNKLVYANKTL